MHLLHMLAANAHLLPAVLAFTLVPLEPDVKVQMVDQLAATGDLSWIVNDDGSITAQSKSGQVKFQPQEPAA